VNISRGKVYQQWRYKRMGEDTSLSVIDAMDEINTNLRFVKEVVNLAAVVSGHRLFEQVDSVTELMHEALDRVDRIKALTDEIFRIQKQNE
jgi:hypothetical protein